MKAQQKLTAEALKHVHKMSANASGEAVGSLDAIGGGCNSIFEKIAGDYVLKARYTVQALSATRIQGRTE